MSDIFISAGPECDMGAVQRHLAWRPQTRSWTGRFSGLDWIVARVDPPRLWAPAYDPESGTRVLLGGRLAPEEAEWKAAESRPYEGGLACRIVIDRWLRGGERAVQELNGGAQILLIDERQRKLHVWTDRMGFYPAYVWRGRAGFLLSSHPDAAADALEAAGHAVAFDATTMAEFLRTGTSVHPRTYWHGIVQMDAATHFEFDFHAGPRLRTSSVYWQPSYLRGEAYMTDRAEIVERLSAAMASAVRRRSLPRLGKVGVLLSAGADSRTALFAASDPAAVTCYTLYDEQNAEFRGAASLAAAAGAEHVGYQRHRDYYIEHAAETVRITGGTWSVDSGHYAGLLDQLSGDRHGVVLSGCYADYLLKGLSYNRRHRTFLGHNLPLYTLAGPTPRYYQPFSGLEPGWLERVDRRLRDYYANLAGGSTHPASAAEYLRLSPIVREADAAGRLMLRRATAVDFFTADNDVLEVACSMHPEQKVNGIAFGMAVARLTGPIADRIPNNNYGARVGAQEWQRVVGFLRASALRKIRRQGSGQPYLRNPESVATAGSWPYFPRIVRMSGPLRAWREDMPVDQQDFLFDILGPERRSWSMAEWGDHEAHLLLRLYTASLWLSCNRRALTNPQVG
jgi:asparagine synthase (glutamine-hydrolysing)